MVNCASEAQVECLVVVSVDDPRVAGEQAPLLLAPIALGRCGPAGLSEMEVDMNDGQACLHSKRAREGALPGPGHPGHDDAAANRRGGISHRPKCPAWVGLGATQDAARFTVVGERDPRCGGQVRGPVSAAKHPPQPCFASGMRPFPADCYRSGPQYDKSLERGAGLHCRRGGEPTPARLLLVSPIALRGRRGTVELARCSGPTRPHREQQRSCRRCSGGRPQLPSRPGRSFVTSTARRCRAGVCPPALPPGQRGVHRSRQ
jgi:hypothetical protein